MKVKRAGGFVRSGSDEINKLKQLLQDFRRFAFWLCKNRALWLPILRLKQRRPLNQIRLACR